MIEFKSAKELVGKLARRTWPNKIGDYSFIMEPVLIREVTEDKIMLTTVYGHKLDVTAKNYDDNGWVEAKHGITSAEVANIYTEYLLLSRRLDEERRQKEDQKNGRT